MNGLLLDTHAFVWAIGAPHRLGRAARRAIEEPRGELWVSAVSGFELATKHRRGRFPEAGPILDQFTQLLEQLRARPLPIDVRHALRAGSLEWEHRDPFDRILAAQAITMDLSFVSTDAAFRKLRGLRVVW